MIEVDVDDVNDECDIQIHEVDVDDVGDYVLIPTCCGHVIVMPCASVLKDPEQQTHPFLDWGA